MKNNYFITICKLLWGVLGVLWGIVYNNGMKTFQVINGQYTR